MILSYHAAIPAIKVSKLVYLRQRENICRVGFMAVQTLRGHHFLKNPTEICRIKFGGRKSNEEGYQL